MRATGAWDLNPKWGRAVGYGLWALLLLPGLWAGVLAAADSPARRQLLTLPASKTPRFVVTDREWPGTVDQPKICLWHEDALAALSITIDDNTAPDHAWWMEQAAKFRFRATWFVITAQVNDAHPGYFGDWNAFRRLHAQGHDIQSHSVTHLVRARGFDPADPEKNVEAEYRKSKDAIAREIPGQAVLTLAYPGGATQKADNDEAKAMQHYIAARGGAALINPANRIDYRRTFSVGGGLAVGADAPERTRIENLLDPGRPSGQYRGWLVTHFHQVKDPLKPGVVEALKYLQDKREDIWIGTFREVAQYGQERDTARLGVDAVSRDALRLTLTDDMSDERFDFPLTLKLRLPENWKNLRATQAGRLLASRILTHEGSRYALIQAVPDRGPIMLRPAPAALSETTSKETP
jgi:peptidoglycan/xylan/chitin deacetylase (PgdA/CDA1 family)